VVDPVRQIEGVFTWHGGKPKPCEHYWVGERIVADTHVESLAVGGPEGRRSPGPPASASSSASGGPANPTLPAQIESPYYQVVLILLACLLGIMMHSVWARFTQGGRFTEGELQAMRSELHAMQLGVMHDAWINRAIKPGLGEDLNLLERQIRLIEDEVGQLAVDHLDQLKGKERTSAEKRWRIVLAALEDGRHQTNAMESRFALTPEQTDELLRERIRQQRAARAKDAADQKAGTSKATGSAAKAEKPGELDKETSKD
jgi:hypothetical protein